MSGYTYGGRRRRVRYFLAFALLALIGYCLFAFFPWRSEALTLTLEQGLTRMQIADKLGAVLDWDEAEKKEFAATYAKMQWMAFSDELPPLFKERHGLTDGEVEILLTSSSEYVNPEYDFLTGVYAPGSYAISSNDSFSEISSALIDPLAATTSLSTYISDRIDERAEKNVIMLIRSHSEKLPDLVPIPPLDVKLEKNEDGQYLLRFTTSFYNQGKGPLELRADPGTAGIRQDIERRVFQRVYRNDGTTRDRPAGTFLWHQTHLHYHFADFAVYDLEAVETDTPPPDLSGVRQKSTFCIRDVSHTDLKLENEPADALYKICGKELQGISVGWADTYFYTYPDQLLNVTDLPNGTYRLKFIINPGDRFDEVTTGNNVSSAVVRIDLQKETVEIVGEEPSVYPKIEHVYPEQNCPVCTL